MKALALFLISVCAWAASASNEIKLDQVGYLPAAAKVALVVSRSAAGDFTVRRAADNKEVFRGKLSEAVADADSGDSVQAADFSALKQPGKYYLDVPGVGRSWPFSVASDVYQRAYYLSIRSFYGQRCGTAVDMGPEFPGYKYEACHTVGAYHPSSGKSGPAPSVKGWHDAGDYGRYIVNSGISTGTLLWTWEMFAPRVKKISLNIPESKDKTPDLLDEIRWNLDWMLTMQDQDGGVFHKQTTEKFSGFVMPEEDKAPSVVIGVGKEPFKGSCATADFAAVMAIAARVYKPFDAAYAAKALQSARQAWTWVEANPNVLYRNPPGVNTGAYGDRSCSDERLWAAAELWRTTREAAYEKYFLANWEAERKALAPGAPAEGWAHVGALGLWTYVLGGARDAAADAIRQDSLLAADAIVERTGRNGYRHALLTRDYVWGSNGVAANYGLQLLVTNALKKDPRYVAAALDTLHYMLGRNTFSLSFVTALGENPYRHPHHRPSGADKNPEPWPGMLSGGPNANRQDPQTQALPKGTPPAKIYVDEEPSYASNEMAINWNAPLVFLLAGVLPEGK